MKLEYYESINDPDRRIVSVTRDAGKVSRMHTYGITNYSVASHTYNMMQMLIAFYPLAQIPQQLTNAVMAHDVPEVLLGDVPAPAKATGNLGYEFHKAEAQVFQELYYHHPLEELDPSNKMWLRALDLIELYLWILEEIGSGNRSHKLKCILRNISSVLMKANMPLELETFRNNLVDEGWEGVVPEKEIYG